DLDVVLDMTGGGAQLPLPMLARRGAITITCAGHASASAFDRAFVERQSTVRVAARLDTPDGAARELTYASSQLDLGSIGRSRNELRWKMTRVAINALERLATSATPTDEGERGRTPGDSISVPQPPGALESISLFGWLLHQATIRRLRMAPEC